MSNRDFIEDNERFCDIGNRRRRNFEDYCDRLEGSANEIFQINNENNLNHDIFIRLISDDDPLWRVRVYILGLLYADGSISTERGNTVSITQNIQDFDILENAQKALGGKISGPYKGDMHHLNAYGKNLVTSLKILGMKERHSVESVALTFLPPSIIKNIINGQTLVRDFVRGFFEGDGTFSGSMKERSVRFGFSGAEPLLSIFNTLILNEIPELTTFISNESIRIFSINGKDHRVYSSLRIYIKGQGFYELSASNIRNGSLYTTTHPWLKRLHITGSLNCIKFFNWLYENNDNFLNTHIKGFKICASRKFLKCLDTLGNFSQRKEKLAPTWADILPELISQLQARFYKINELMQLANMYLYNKLKDLNLDYMFEINKINNSDIFRNKLKIMEYNFEILGSFQERVGRSNINQYFSKINPPQNIPANYKRKIELVDRNGNLKKNLKNLIIYIFLLKDQNSLSFNEIREILDAVNIFSKTTLRPNRILNEILELKSFDIVIQINDEKNDDEQKYILNNSKIPLFYGVDSSELIEILGSYYQLKIKKK